MMPVAAYRSLATGEPVEPIVPADPSLRRGFWSYTAKLAVAAVAVSNFVTLALTAALDRPGLAEERLASAADTPVRAISMAIVVAIAVMLGRRQKLSFLRGAGGWWFAMIAANVTDAFLGAMLRTFAF
jgi:hypothetical protein